MAKPKIETRLAVIVEYPAGDRAAYTVPVNADTEAAVLRASSIRERLAAETGCTVRVDTFTHSVSA